MPTRIKTRTWMFFVTGVIGLWVSLGVASVPKPRPARLERTEVERWIGELDDPTWEIRDRATQSLLDGGATVVPQLYTGLANASPEARVRIEWILSQLDPVVHCFRVLRWQAVAGSGPWTVIEYCDQEITGLFESTPVRMASMESGRGLSTESVAPLIASPSLSCNVLQADPGCSVEVELALPGAQSTRIALNLEPGKIALLREETATAVEIHGARIQRTVFDLAWTIELVRVYRKSAPPPEVSSPPGPPSLADLESHFERSLDSGLSEPSHSRVAAIRIATLLRRSAWIQKQNSTGTATRLLESDDAALTGWWRVATAVLNPNEETLEALATWVEAHDRPLDDVVQAAACELLIRNGHATGVDRLLGRISELGPWIQARTLTAIATALRNDRFAEDRVQELFDTVASIEHFEYLPWRGHQLAGEVLQLLAQRVDPAHAVPVLQDRLAEAAEQGPVGAARLIPLLRTVRLVDSAEAVLDKDRHEDIQFQLLSTGASFEYAFCWIRDRLLAGQLTDESWGRFIEAAEEIYAQSNGPSYQFDQMLNSLVLDPRIEPERVREIWALRARSLQLLPNNRRRRAHNDLDARFGKLFTPVPATQDDEGWSSRSEEWQEYVATVPSDSDLRPQGGEVLRFTEADVRIPADPESDPEVLSFWHGELSVGIARTRTSEDGRDDTILISAQTHARASGYRLNRSTIRLQTPRITGNPRRYLYQTWEFARGDYTPRYVNHAQRGGKPTASFKSAVYLESPDSDPIESWKALIERWVDVCRSDPTLAKTHLKAIGDAKLTGALLALQALYEENPSDDLALTLFALGDDRGRTRLIELLGTQSPQQAAPTALALLKQGDREVVEMVLEWFQDADRMRYLRGTSWQMIGSLEVFARNHPAIVEARRELWAQGLVAAMSHRNTAQVACRVLRGISGQDFGYETVTRQQSGQERIKAQAEIVEKWRTWLSSEFDVPKPASQ